MEDDEPLIALNPDFAARLVVSEQSWTIGAGFINAAGEWEEVFVSTDDPAEAAALRTKFLGD